MSDLLWLGWVGQVGKPDGFVSAANLELAIQRFNDTLLSVCQSEGLECFDLAAKIPRDTSAFYDDCHFNDDGSRLVAEHLGSYLSERLEQAR